MPSSFNNGTDGRIIISGLLTYVFHHIRNHPVDSIKAVLLNHYSTDAIHTAKVALWEGYAATLPKWAERRKGIGNRQQEKEVEDIIRSVVDIDKKFGDSDSFLPCTFMVADLNMLPTKKPGAIDDVALHDRVTRLERLMADVQAAGQRPAYADVVRRSTGSHTGLDECHGSVAPSTDRRCANEVARPDISGPAGELPCSASTPSLTVDLPYVDAVQRDPDGYILPPEQAKRARRREGALHPQFQQQQQGQQLQQRQWRKQQQQQQQQQQQRQQRQTANGATRKRLPKYVTGTRDSTKLQCAPRRYDLFLFRLN